MAAPMGSRVLQSCRLMTRLWTVSQPSCCALQVQQTRLKSRKSAKSKKKTPVKRKAKMPPGLFKEAEKEKKLAERHSRFLKKVPVHDIWLRAYYPPPVYSMLEALEAHRELACPEMLDSLDSLVTVKAELNMKAKKEGKFLASISDTILLPHDFDDGTRNQIMAFVKTQDEKTHAMEQGVALAGGVELIQSIKDLEVYLADYNHIICTMEMLPEVASLRKILKEKYPSKQKGSISTDLDSMIDFFSRGKTYNSTRVTEATANLEVHIGTLDMPLEHIQENFAAYVQALFRPKSSGRLVKSAVLVCPPSTERLKIKDSELVPSKGTKTKAAKKKEIVEEENETEPETVAEDELKVAQAVG